MATAMVGVVAATTPLGCSFSDARPVCRPASSGVSLTTNFFVARPSLRPQFRAVRNSRKARHIPLPARAAKLPTGVDPPREEPKLPKSLWGFTENAEVWNSRAAMIGIFGIVIVEAIINRGVLQVVGIEIGKGLDLPL